jgi:hypothetical protein
VGDNSKLHQATAVTQWLAAHPRCVVLWGPTDWPRANPMERACGDVHDQGPRHHNRQRLRDGVRDVVWHRQANGPWLDKLSHL